MYSNPSDNLDFFTHEDFLNSTNEILSKLHDLETTLNSYTTHSSPKKIHQKNYQYHNKNSWYEGQYSWRKQPMSIHQDKYSEDIVSTLSYDEEHYHDGNSILANEDDYPNTELYETTYNREHSSKKNTSSGLVSYIQVRSPVTKNKKEHSDSQNYALNLKHEYRDAPDISLEDMDKQQGCRKSYVDDRQSATMCSRGNEILPLPSSSPTEDDVKHPSQSEEATSGIWHMGKKGFVPPKTAPVAKTRKGIALFAGRVFHQGTLVPATISPEEGLAFYSWNGKVFSTNNFEILEIHNFAWEDEVSASERLHRFKIGRMSDGKPLYLGRAYIEGRGPWVGRVHMDDKYIFIAFRGNELRIPPPYEILVTY